MDRRGRRIRFIKDESVSIFNSFLKVSLAVSFLFAGSLAQANFIVNGSFENNDVKDGGWRWFDASLVEGWQGGNIEIWDGLRGVEAFAGEQHAELNAHPNNGQAFSIFQLFETEKGKTYDLSFAYQARRNNREAFKVEVVGVDALIDLVIDDHERGMWSVFNHAFTADSAETVLRFTSVFPETNTTGNFLDNISIDANVPLPAGGILLFSCLIILSGVRKIAMSH